MVFVWNHQIIKLRTIKYQEYTITWDLEQRNTEKKHELELVSNGHQEKINN